MLRLVCARVAVLLAAVLSLNAAARSLVASPETFKPIPPDWRPPTVAVHAHQGQPIQLRAVSVRSTVAAGQAQTVVEMRLFNPNHRMLEGELQFPLLEGQVVTGFALDANGRLRDAVAVPKARGQEIFEDIRRRRVDPGLLEATAGNQYKLRVYPLPPQGERRVQITVSETLPRDGRGTLLRLPLAFGAPVGTLDVDVIAPGAQARGLRGPDGIQAVPDADGRLRIRFQRQGWQAPRGAAGWLQVPMRDVAQPQILTGETGGQRFFAAHIPFADELVPRPQARHVALVWDASGSSARQARVLPVLDAYFRAQRAPVRVSVLVVRNQAEPVREFTVAPDGFAQLAEWLRAQPLDGSSNFDELPIPAGVDATLLVSDGLMTDGRRSIGYRHKAPLFAINGATAADVPRLSRLAEATGGAYIDAAEQTAQRAARAMLHHGWRIERMHGVSATRLVAPSAQVRDGRVAIAGRMDDAKGNVQIVLAHPDGRRRTLAADLSRASPAGRWPGQLWAQWRSAELAQDAVQNANELRRIAAEHGIVGPNSSLIVLELASDYVQFDLPAPPDVAAEASQLRQQQLAQQRVTQQAWLDQVARQFDARQRWWEREFPKEPPKREQGPAGHAAAALGEARERIGERARMERGAAARSAPVPAPAPVAVAPAAPAAAQQLARKAVSADQAAATSGIALQAWTPDAPYLRRLADAPADALYAAYLDERPQYESSSAFFMDVAGVFFQRGEPRLALRILSNLAEMNLESRQLLRLYAYRLVQAKHNALAVPAFERIAALAPNEPQSWRDLGLALADSGQHQRAVETLWEVVSRPWHGRFSGVTMIALAELNAIAAQAQARGAPLDLSRVDPRLRRNLPLALRVVMAWDTDDTDIDLWVTDPNGEAANFGRPLTTQGGAMSPDATGGYGPEEYALRDAKPGKYSLQARFYGHSQQVLTGSTTAMVRVTLGFGTAAARDEWITVRLQGSGSTVQLGEVEVK